MKLCACDNGHQFIFLVTFQPIGKPEGCYDINMYNCHVANNSKLWYCCLIIALDSKFTKVFVT